jgi:hypothetical protein
MNVHRVAYLYESKGFITAGTKNPCNNKTPANYGGHENIFLQAHRWSADTDTF